MKICTQCNKNLKESEFYWKVKNKGWRSSYCKECQNRFSKNHYNINKEDYLKRQRIINKEWRQNMRIFLLEYLKKHPRVDCGITDVRVLEFDHVRGIKKYNISSVISSCRKWTKITKEIAKCDVRCANCHAIRTCESRKYYKGI